MVALIPLVLSLLFGSPLAIDDSNAIKSMRELRYADVLGQQDWWTCGAAAVATWLTYFLDRPTTETHVLTVAVRYMEERGGQPSKGLSLLSLREALASFGVQAAGYRVDPEILKEHFASGGHPVLIHMTEPRLHYALAVGAQDNHVFLADPSFGRRVLSFDALIREKGFDGVVLAVTPDSLTAPITTKNQEAFVKSLQHRRRQLRQVREGGSR